MVKYRMFFLIFLYCSVFYGQKNEYLEKADSFISKGKELDSALVYIDAALKRDKNDINANLMKISVLELKKDCNGMQDILNVLESIKDINKQNLFFFKARKMICEQKPDQAITLLEDYLKLNPESYVILLELGREYINKGDYESAVKKLYNAITVNPKNIDAYTILSDIFNQAGRYNENILMLKKGLEITKDSEEGFYQLLSSAYISMDYYARAEYYIDKAIAINPAGYYISQKNYIKTEKDRLYSDYQKNISLLSSESCQGKVLYDILQYEYSFDMLVNMVTTANKGVECNFTKEQIAYFYNRILVSLLYQKKYKDAEKLLKQIIDKNEAGFDEYFMMALINASKDDYKPALIYCEKAEAINKNSDLDYLKMFLLLKLKKPEFSLQVDKIKNDGNTAYLLNSIMQDSNKAGVTKIMFNPNKDFKIFEIKYEFSGKDLEMLMKAIKT